MKNFLKIIFTLLIILNCSTIFLFGCNSDNHGTDNTTSNAETSSNTVSTKKDKLLITDTQMTIDYHEYTGNYYCEITGKAKNVSGKDLSYVSIDFSIYDEEGINLGTATDLIQNLAADETYRFTAILYSASAEPKTFKLVKQTGW